MRRILGEVILLANRYAERDGVARAVFEAVDCLSNYFSVTCHTPGWQA